MQIKITDGLAHLLLDVASFSSDSDSGDWVATVVSAELPGFQAAFSGELTVGELKGFHQDLARLYVELKGTARLNAVEGFFDITAEADVLGHIQWAVEISDNTGSVSMARLRFQMQSDQSYLPAVLEQLAAALQQ